MKAVIIAFLNFLLTFLTDGKLGLNVDYSVFRHSESQSYLEIFYSLQKSKLSYNYKDGKI